MRTKQSEASKRRKARNAQSYRDKVQPTTVKGPLGEYTQEHQIQPSTSIASKKVTLFKELS